MAVDACTEIKISCLRLFAIDCHTILLHRLGRYIADVWMVSFTRESHTIPHTKSPVTSVSGPPRWCTLIHINAASSGLLR